MLRAALDATIKKAKLLIGQAYAWEVATVGVCFHVLFSSSVCAFGFERLDFLSSFFFDGFGFFCVAFS